MENELIASKDFYLLSVDIFKILSLERGTRMINGKTYLDETYQTYCKLIENSNIVNAEMKNMITPSGHLSLSPKLLSTTKEEVGIEIPTNKPILLIHEIEEEKDEDKHEIYIKTEERTITNLAIEKENIIIQELEENNKLLEIQEEEKEELILEEKDTTVSEEEELSNKIIPKTKRKYTKKIYKENN